jgi:hypothetical protein
MYMRVSALAAFTVVALCALAACGKPAPTSGPLAASQIPHSKPGLWREVTVTDGADPAGPGTQLCVDDAVSKARMSALAQRTPGAPRCRSEYTRNLDGSISVLTSCDIGKYGKVVTTSAIKGDFNSSYTTTTDRQISGSPVAGLNGDHKTTVIATWLGPCAPGQRVGDMILPDGTKRNILDALTAAAPSAAN